MYISISPVHCIQNTTVTDSAFYNHTTPSKASFNSSLTLHWWNTTDTKKPNYLKKILS